MISREIKFFDYPRCYIDNKESYLNIFNDVCSRGAFIMQSDLHEFEQLLKKFTGTDFAVGVANATDGLELAWMAVGLNPGDEVICSSHTMIATASAVKTAGGTPVPVEIGNDGLIDPDAIEAAINSKTVGIMPTQLNGRICDMEKIMAIASKYNLSIVEDAAQALGSRYKGRHAGTFGLAAAISFFPAKLLGSFGDGGAVITCDNQVYEGVYQLHDHGRDTSGEVKRWGRNSRLDNLQAAILSYNLASYNQIIERRRYLAGLYHAELSDLSELELPPPPNSDPDYFDVYQNYELQADRRDELKEYLKNNGVGTLIQWGGKAVHQWEHLGFTVKLPKVERFFQHCLMLPMNIFISEDDVMYICKKIRVFYRG